MILDFRPVLGFSSSKASRPHQGHRGSAVIIDLAERRKRVDNRSRLVEQARILLETSGEALAAIAFEIALSDSWYDWDQTIPPGTRIEIGPEELLSCTDHSVRHIASVIIAIQNAIGEGGSGGIC